MSLRLISTTFDFPCDFLNNLIQNLSKGVRIDNPALKALKSFTSKNVFCLNKKTPEDAYAGCVGIERITGMLDGNGKLNSVCNKCVQERRKQNLHQYYHHIC